MFALFILCYLTRPTAGMLIYIACTELTAKTGGGMVCNWGKPASRAPSTVTTACAAGRSLQVPISKSFLGDHSRVESVCAKNEKRPNFCAKTPKQKTCYILLQNHTPTNKAFFECYKWCSHKEAIPRSELREHMSTSHQAAVAGELHALGRLCESKKKRRAH